MSAPGVELSLGLLVETSLEAAIWLGVVQAVATRVPRAAQRHRLRAVGLLTLPVLAWATHLGAPRLEGDSTWLMLWAGGVLACLAPLAVSLIRLAVATHRTRPGPDGSRLSSAIRVPLTWGLIRPVVLLPESASAWPASELQLALAHERAHIARRDWAVQLATEGICALLWFHPLVWWVRRDLLLDAELAADQRVLGAGVVPKRYARHLVDRFEGAQAPHAATPAGRPSQLGARIHAALAPAGAPRSSALLLLLVPVLVGLAWAHPLPDAPPPACNPTPSEIS